LVDKSLLRRTGERYWMLETIREFAAERLEELGEAASLQDRHAAWFVALGARVWPELQARRGREGLDQLEADHANLRVTLDHLLACGDAISLLQLSEALSFYWQARGHWTEGRRYLAAAVALGEGAEPEHLIGPIWSAGLLALWLGDLDDGRQHALRLLELAQQAQCQRAELGGIHLLAMEAGLRGDLNEANPLQEEVLRLARAGDDQWFLSVALDNLGSLRLSQRAYEQAVELFEESLAIGEARGDLDRRARELTNLGVATRALGDTLRALTFFRRGLAAAVELGHSGDELTALYFIAACEAEIGDAVAAARLFGWTKEHWRRLGAADDVEALDDDLLARVGEALGPERLAAELSAGAALSREGAINLGRPLFAG
jgi:non-specific serine/threonine protein kinase